MPSPEINTNYFDSNGVDLGKKLISKDYLLSVYPQIANQIITPELWIWGQNSAGQLGDNTTTTRSTPVTTFAGGANWKQVSCGYRYMAAIKTDGTLWAWGRNSDGQLGDNTIINKITPVTTFSGGTNWNQISCGYTHIAAIKTDGTLWTWGNNSNGQLGENTLTTKRTPVTTFSGGTNWKQVSCSGSDKFITAAIKTDGTLWTWGRNSYGQLGDNTTTDKRTPITTFAGGSNWKQVSCGYRYMAAIKTDGTLWAWGRNSFGQLADNTSSNKITPVTTFAGGTNWKQVSGGYTHIAAIKTDGTLWTWGQNVEGSLGINIARISQLIVPRSAIDGTNWQQMDDVNLLTTLSCGSSHTAAIKTDGTLWTWGSNSNGKLGDNKSSFFDTSYTPVTTFAGGTDWKHVSGSSDHTAAIKTDGTLWIWGRNSYGQLGDNTTTNRLTPVTTFAGGTDWKQVSCGSSHTAAIKTDGTLWTWGNNSFGQLADNTSSDKMTPVTTFAGGTNWNQISCGYRHTAAIKTDGTLWIWGRNNAAQLGDNTITNRSTPVTTFSGGTNWKQVSCGGNHTAAIKTDGTLWTWGNNLNGQLADNTSTQRITPVTTFAGGTNWKQVSCGQFHMAAVKIDGTLWTWGSNNAAQLGDNTITNRSIPVTTFAGGTNWNQVSGGASHTAAIKTDGTVWAWGNNDNEQTGVFSQNRRLTPVTTFVGGTNWKQVSCGGYFIVSATKTDGTLWSWGSNSFGQIGDNTITSRSTPVTTFAGGTDWKQVSCGTYHQAAIRSIENL